NYILGELNFDEVIEYLNILGMNPKILQRKKDDFIFEIESPANRPDLLSFIGLLREILPFGKFSIKEINGEIEEEIDNFIPVEIEDIKDCPYYSCRIIKGINNTKSNQEFKEIIEDIGFRSSFLVVDISNFVMCEVGQPLHIFDLDKIKGKIIVRRGRKGEKLITIDGKDRDVEDILIIADEEKPIAIAGIMGGANTEVSEETKNILIESAYFSQSIIRRGSKKLGLITEASLRFEKGLNVTMAEKGMERATIMIKKFCGGQVGRISFAGTREETKKQIYLKKEKIEKILGIKVEDEFLKDIFEKLNFGIKKENGEFLLTISEYRKDVKEDIDIIEEIAKYKKYMEIPLEIPYAVIKPSFLSSNYEIFKKIRNILVNLGFWEVITLSFISDLIAKKFLSDTIEIENPLSQSFSFLRNSLIFNVLEVVKYNLSYQNRKIEIFELGKVYKKDGEENFEEKDSLLIVSLNVGTFFDFKGKIEKFFYECGLENLEYIKEYRNFAESGTNYGIYYSEEKVGDLFLPSEELKNFYDIEGEIYICEILIENLLKYINFEKKFKQLPKFPFSQRDFSFLFPENINWKEIEKEIMNLNLPIEKIEVFDIYRGKNIPDDKISVSFSITFRSLEKTLDSEEIDNFSKLIIKTIEGKFKGKLRGENV
ncbi:MAG: phenylalanine--tRNA ligase subunit beta, partial [Candidatus Omnitrophica bacterium]|nr:phenylalanine--tRNA ligase subunit beta [Candidatus Omnitrophota bacterium]